MFNDILKFFWRARNLKVEQGLRENAGIIIPNLSSENLKKVREILEQGVACGENPQTIALDLVGRIDSVTKKRTGGVIGLSDKQIEERNNAISYLECLDTRYLSIMVRDKRFDRTVKKAIDMGKPILPEQIDRIITSYENGALLYRGIIIAQTEILRSINKSEYLAHLQAVQDGSLQAETLTKEWDDCGDEHVRSSHAIMGQKYGTSKGIRIDEPFILPSGAKLLYPGDTSFGAPMEELEGCRCRARYNVDWLARCE